MLRKFTFMTLRCDSWNCLSTGVCGETAATPHHFGTWVYVLVALGIIGGKELAWMCIAVFFPNVTMTCRDVWYPYGTLFCPQKAARARACKTCAILEGTGLSQMSVNIYDHPDDTSCAECLPSKPNANEGDCTGLHSFPESWWSRE